VDLDDDVTYLVIQMGSVSFCIPSCDVLELSDALYVLGLTKNILLVSTMTNLKTVVDFDDKQFIIIDHN
jgi:hypothetical protein